MNHKSSIGLLFGEELGYFINLVSLKQFFSEVNDSAECEGIDSLALNFVLSFVRLKRNFLRLAIILYIYFDTIIKFE